MRIGSGSTIDAAPASQQPCSAVTSARLVGPRMATWSPGAMPRAWRAAPTARASSWSCAQVRKSPSAPATEAPTSRMPVGLAVARSSRLTMGVGDDIWCANPPGTVAITLPAAAVSTEVGHARTDRGREQTLVAEVAARRIVPMASTNDAVDDVVEHAPAAGAADSPAHRYSAAMAADIEHRWQERWDAEHTFEAPNPAGPLADPGRVGGRPKLFILDMFPYPSGAGLHVGHPLGYIGTDVFGRYRRMKGFNVLHTLGYDAFGLPAEQYAIETGTHPQVRTEENVANYRRQLHRLGLAHDPRRSISTTDESYYRWTQWIFLQIFESWYDRDQDRARPIAELREELAAGTRPTPDGRPWASLSALEQRQVVDDHRLAYISEAPVNWCPGLGTVLANEEVTAEGRSDRGNFPVFRRNMRQWMMRITAYADRLIDDLDAPRLARLHQDHAAQLDRSIRGRDGLVHVGRGVDRGVHHAAGHALRRHVHGAGPRAPHGRRPDRGGVAGADAAAVDRDVRHPGGGGQRLPRRRRGQDGPGPPGRRPRQDRRLHGVVRGQPRQRRPDPRSSSPTTS